MENEGGRRKRKRRCRHARGNAQEGAYAVVMESGSRTSQGPAKAAGKRLKKGLLLTFLTGKHLRKAQVDLVAKKLESIVKSYNFYYVPLNVGHFVGWTLY